MPERSAQRAVQLRKGIEGAAAAVRDAHAALGERAAAVAARAAARAASLEEARLAELIASLERLHYALLQVGVLEDSPARTGLEAAIGELEARLPDEAKPGGGGEVGAGRDEA